MRANSTLTVHSKSIVLILYSLFEIWACIVLILYSLLVMRTNLTLVRTLINFKSSLYSGLLLRGVRLLFFRVTTHTLLTFSHCTNSTLDRTSSKVVSIVTLYSKCPGALHFQNLCGGTSSSGGMYPTHHATHACILLLMWHMHFENLFGGTSTCRTTKTKLNTKP
jgi:hypothetical protein